MAETIKLTREEIEAGRSPAGGFTKRKLATWGVPYPPPSGWMEMLMAGDPVVEQGKSTADLLREVVLAVIESGHAEILWGMPDVLDHFGAQLPEDRSLLVKYPTRVAG